MSQIPRAARRVGGGFVSLLFILVAGASSAQAATREWIGPNGGNWSVPTNWDPIGAPAPTDDVVFPVGSPATSFNDLSGMEVISITFQAAHAISGNQIGVTGHVEAVDGISALGSMRVMATQTWTVGATAALSANIITFENAPTWTIDGADANASLTVASVNGTGAIVKNGALLLRINGGSGFAGPVTINEGTMEVRDSGGLGVADGTPANGTTVNAGGALFIVDVGTLQEHLTLNGTGVSDTGALRFRANSPLTVAAPVVLESLVSIIGDVDLTSRTVIFQQAITGANDLVVLDTTTVALAHPDNTFSRVTFAGTQDGTLRMDHGSALADTGGITIPGPATLDVNGQNTTLPWLIGSGTITNSGITATLTIRNTVDTSFTGSITGALWLTKQGAAELMLGGASTYVGQTHVQAGTLRITHANALGLAGNGALASKVTGQAVLILDGVSPGVESFELETVQPTDAPKLTLKGPAAVTINGRIDAGSGAIISGTNGANLTLNGLLNAVGALRVEGLVMHATNPSNFLLGRLTIANATYDVGGGKLSAVSLPVTVAAGGTLALQGTAATITQLTGEGTVALGTNGTLHLNSMPTAVFNGTITGSGEVRNLGGVLTLAGPTTYTGTFNVIAGEVIVAHAGALVAPSIAVALGCTLTYAVSSTHTGPLALSGFGAGLDNGALRVTGGSVTLAGPTTLGGGQAPIISVAAPHTLTFAGLVTGANSLLIQDGGTVVFGSAPNSVSTIQLGSFMGSEPGGTVRVGAADALPPLALTMTEGSTFDAGGFSQTLTSVFGKGTLSTGPASGVLTLDGPMISAFFEGTLAGQGVVKALQGLSLTGTSTLSGSLEVTGTLTINGTLPASVHVNGTAVTIWPGSVVGPLTTEGELYLSIGQPAGTQGVTLGGLNLGEQTSLNVIIPAGTAGPGLAVNGSVELHGECFYQAAEGQLPSGDFMLIANDGTDPIVGTCANLQEDDLFGSGVVAFRPSYSGGTGNDLVITAGLTYHLSEGATGPFFDTQLLIANPHPEPVEFTVYLMPEEGDADNFILTLQPMSRRTITVDNVEGFESTSFSTIVQSLSGKPLIVERTMRWDESGYGGHTEKATAGPATTWYFAEGSEGFFRTFLLLANPQETANVAHVTYLREGAPAIERTYQLEPSSRRTIQAADDEELVNQAFGITVTFAQPGVAERAMYFGDSPVLRGGHESMGVTSASTTWFLAEGATGAGFDTFILVSNPGQVTADVTFTFLPENGEPATLTRTVGPQSRLTINPEAENLSIPEGPVATQVVATQPVIAERAQYWPFGPVTWTEAHNSFGVTEAAAKWGLAEGRAGGELGYQTYILLANAGTEPANVTVTFLGDDNSPTPATQTVVVPAQRRVNVSVDPSFDPEEGGLVLTTFGALITSDQPIVVERAMYWNVNGEVWAAGTNATATRLP